MRNKKRILILTLFMTLVFSPLVLLAETGYTPLAPLPDLAPGVDNGSFTYFIQNSFYLLIGVAGVLAVIMIMLGGIQYMSTDAIGGKEEGKEKITKALLGLLLAIGAWLILNTINPAILGLDLSIPSPPPPPTSYAIKTSYYLYLDEHTSQGGCRYDAFEGSDLTSYRFQNFEKCKKTVENNSGRGEYPYKTGPKRCEVWSCVGVNE